jgi:hypothetical protein
MAILALWVAYYEFDRWPFWHYGWCIMNIHPWPIWALWVYYGFHPWPIWALWVVYYGFHPNVAIWRKFFFSFLFKKKSPF